MVNYTSTNYGHFRKKWKNLVITNFNQPILKIKRRKIRKNKKKNFLKKAIFYKKLKPLVKCPTRMHNTKIKLGRGFSIQEIKKSMIKLKTATSYGISIDKRRKKSNILESNNIIRLNKLYNLYTKVKE
ncbi:60S ribosomal protein L13 [Guillardia theta]|uniref:60S ribosomal protein L13 n=1 Tax=Guillardia theta TaxID=55529 RepID=Q9AW85_GUITH|nr:60S ribosomal protein L13 [Guillardia theta]CAC26984.1 60S ribosomal protein L13 [Guillardia theta]|mmetsp:Transcript_39723/g.124782  ORF Transcript_39723/g.124782 Transcript_39723/m.124782 type:complete len:128 (+) Transcript_39723:622-1005(+)